MKLVQVLGFVFGLSLGSGQLFAYANCPQGHCSLVSAEMNNFCIGSGLAGKPYLVIGPSGGNCLCPCSCVSPDTKILLNDSSSTVALGDLSLGADLASPYANKSNNLVGTVLASDFSEFTTKVLELSFANGSTLLSSTDHTFVSPDERVLAAAELKPGALVLDENGKTTQLLKNDEINAYSGKLMNFVINSKSNKAKDHFIVNNGIRSGDWLVQANYASFKNEIDVRLGNLKSFGTAEPK